MPPSPPGAPIRVFFYVQHLLGIGHLHRAARIVRALTSDGFRVRLVLGGPASPGLDVGQAEILQLPPVKAGPTGFSRLAHLDGRFFDKDDEAARTRLLLDDFDRFAPDILVTEAFPFGRRQMRFELLPLLTHARRRPEPPLVVASVRDILQRDGRPERAVETVEAVAAFYDLVLVHGDPTLARFEDSFPAAVRFADKTTYTGIVAPDPLPALSQGEVASYGVVVSVGGGAVGGPLIEAALSARPLTTLADRPWLFLTGPNLSDGSRAALARQARDGVEVRHFVPDLARLLSSAELSVSQAGYNTVADIVTGGCRAVLIPYGQDGETEQTERARLLERRGAAVMLAEAELTPAKLAAAIERACLQPKAAGTLDLRGAQATATMLRSAVERRTRRD